jgi:serine/threonine-protein kinase
VPEPVEEAVLAALEKLPADRFATAAEFARALTGESKSRRTSSTETLVLTTTSAVRSSRRFYFAITIAVIATALALWGWLGRPAVALPAPVARFAVRLSPPPRTGIVAQAIALSPDGSRIVYVGNGGAGNQLFSRSLDQLQSAPIAGTMGGVNPFFSPDGAWLGFSVGPRMFKISLAGGPPLPICDLSRDSWGATWSVNDTILFADQRGLLRVAASGGVPTIVAAPDSGSGETYRWPEWLPGEKAAIFAFTRRWAEEIAVLSLATGTVKRLGIRGGNPRYVRQGHLLVTAIDSSSTLSLGVLSAIPFDPVRLTVTGPPIPVADSVQTGAASRSVKIGVSRNGAMVLATGRASPGRLALTDRSGKQRPIGDAVRPFLGPRFSPDGRRIAVGITEPGQQDIWIFDLTSKILSRLTFDHGARVPEWSPDGRRVVYSRRGEDYDLASIPSDGSGPSEPLLEAPANQISGALSRDQRYLIVREGGLGMRRRISLVRLDSSGTIRPLLASESFDQYTPALAPNGRWLAYVSEESGRAEVYVRPFPNAGGRFQITGQGGSEPVWARSGRELFFWTGDTLMAAHVSTESEFSLAGTRRLFVSSAVKPGVITNYDVSPDGTTFVVNIDENSEPQVVFVLNWFDHLVQRRGGK